ncbi:hypothetical protein [Photobacterium aquimaris]|uniref:Uncharacterized protein n=1 Tax=Photobacterium aquimaris TaxID=512643 RepID=A0A1Y6L568_9GAMM|nr:hypothetical protein [Photobacterium aquimaris]SMY18465.1 hypothetical protein PAQU9191_03826 [Photobacterium aquimaris]
MTSNTVKSFKKHGNNVKILTDNELKQFANLFGKKGETKTAKVLKAIALNPGITTDEIRAFAKCSNVPNLAHNITVKLLNFGLMIHREAPRGVAPNGAFHHWYLIEAPIHDISRNMAVNDPIL